MATAPFFAVISTFIIEAKVFFKNEAKVFFKNPLTNGEK